MMERFKVLGLSLNLYLDYMMIAFYSIEVLIGPRDCLQPLFIQYALLINDFGGKFASLIEMTSFLQTVVFIIDFFSIDIVGPRLISAVTCD